MSDLTAEVRAALAAHDAEVSGQRGIIIPGPALQHVAAASPSWLAALCDRLDAAEAKLAAAKAALSTYATEAHGCTCTECQIARILNGDPNA